MKPVISPVPGAFVLLRADGVYTEAPLYVGPFDCGFVRNPRGDGYLRLLHAGGTSGAGVDYSGVWGAVLAKGQGNYTVVTPVEEKPCQQADYPQADWSKEAEELRAHLTYITVNAELYVANPTGQVESLLAALSRIEDYTCAARVLCNHIIGSYQKGA